MTQRRAADFDLRRAIRETSFTPARKDVAALFELLAGEEEEQGEIERALARVPEAAGLAAERLASAEPPLRGRLARVIGRAAQAGDAEAAARLLALLKDADAKTRRNAVLYLGRVRAPGVEGALIEHWQAETRADHRRSIAEALGKIGGEKARDLLRGVQADDAELRRIVDRALLQLERTLGRAASASRVDLGRPPPRPLAVRLHCRAGLEPILCDELAAFAPSVTGPGLVEARLEVPPARLYHARTHLGFGFLLPVAPDVAGALGSPEAREILGAFSVGPVRYRLAFAQGGHRRAAVYQAVAAVRERAPELVNDPTRSSWEVLVEERPGGVQLELVPRRAEDPRFTWRKGDVPAASHPTIAAALARAGGARSDDVVWDPFVGSGAELIERHLLGPWAALHGTDTDERALAAARRNLAAAGVTGAQLARADATRHRLDGVTLILTNPPMGRRAARGDVGPLLEAFLEGAARSLAPGGRLVWMSPLPERTAAAARRLGFEVVLRRAVDMGGFTAEMQLLSLPAARGSEPRRAAPRRRPPGTKRR